MKNAEHKAIVDKLKGVLKSRSLTYKGLSELSGIPESSIKKIFSGTDCAFSKLVRICESLDLSFLQVAGSVLEEQERDYFSFTMDQELYFVRNIQCYLFFHYMFRGAMELTEAKEKLGLSDTVMWKYLNKLESFGILEVGPSTKVRFKVRGGIHYLKEGPLQAKILNDVTFRFADYLVNGEMQEQPVDSPFLRLSFGAMTPVNYQKFLQELKEIHKTFADVSVRDRKYHPKEELVETTWLLGLGSVEGLELLEGK